MSENICTFASEYLVETTAQMWGGGLKMNEIHGQNS